MDREAAEAEASKRERHKSKHMTHKRWQAVHDSVRGWHVALVDCPIHAMLEAERRARDALRRGDATAILDAAGDLLMARVRASLGREP